MKFHLRTHNLKLQIMTLNSKYFAKMKLPQKYALKIGKLIEFFEIWNLKPEFKKYKLRRQPNYISFSKISNFEVTFDAKSDPINMQ